MNNKLGIKPKQARVLLELEKLIGKSISLKDKINNYTVGVRIEGDNIIELGLYRCELGVLPESIGNLQSLRTLNLNTNRLTTLPESIRNLTSLRTLNLNTNRLTTLPESIRNLTSLQTLELYDNLLTTLPVSIGNLQSLQTLNLSGNQLTTLPVSIRNLTALQKLKLNSNRLTTFPESIVNLQSLQVLRLRINRLTTLPESIGKLQSLQALDLGTNLLDSLPESIRNLQSLRALDLRFNQLVSLPESLWLLKNLKHLGLEGNLWKGEWIEMAKRDIPSILEFCRQKATINIFISHTFDEFAFYRIKELAEYLEKQPEINQVFFCEEDLKGNIDAWMEETVPKSQLLLFIGTQQSKLSKDCWEERRLALKNEIPIIPIKGLDVDWNDLTSIGLSRELGFEFDEKEFNKLCEKVYKYIYEFKRERDLLRKEQDKIHDIKFSIVSLFKEYITSEVLDKIFSDRYPEIESLEKEFKFNKITFKEFMIKLGELLDVNSKHSFRYYNIHKF